MGTLVLEGLARRYGATVAVERVDLDVQDGELVALLGPSGCGKTTTLRMVAGFVPPSAGRMLIGGRDVTGRRRMRRDIGMVFQSYALFPHMTVGQNVAFGLEMRKVGRAERERRVTEALAPGPAGRARRTGCRGSSRAASSSAWRWPARWSSNPAVLLLDEPLSNLDAKLRDEMRLEIRAAAAAARPDHPVRHA